MYSSGPFPTRPAPVAQKALLTRQRSQDMLPPKAESDPPLRISTQDLGSAVKLPPLANTILDLDGNKQRLPPRELPKSFKTNLQNKKSPLAMTMTQSLPGVINLGENFRRENVRIIRPRMPM